MKTKRDKSDSEHVPDDVERTSDEVVEVPEKQSEHRSSDRPNLLKRTWRGYLRRKKWAVPLTIVLVLGVVFGVPWSRYGVLGLGVKKSFSVSVVDSKTGKPVSEAEVSLAGKMVKTNGEGKAVMSKVRVGSGSLKIIKKYYRGHDEKALVGLNQNKNTKEIKLEATGRQVPVSVINKISDKGLKGVKIAVLDTEAETDDKGEATVVLPAEKATEKISLKLDGYNDNSTEIEISEQLVDKNKLSMTPSGKLYFLSKRSGKIDVVKTNLDGSDRQVVLAGTGREQEHNTTLLASRDWKYLALHSRREGDKAKLYLIDTSNDKLTIMDEGNAFFNIIGWKDDSFLFEVNRQTVIEQHPKRYAIKAYSANKKSLTILDESDAVAVHFSRLYQMFDNFYITRHGLVYTKRWVANFYQGTIGGKHLAIAFVKTDGTGKKDFKTFPIESTNYITSRPYAPDEIYFAVHYSDKDKPEYFEYEDGGIKPANIDAQQFEKGYPTFLLSPSSKNTFWSESRDGKNTLFVGNAEGKEPQEIGTASELGPYGWYGEDYLLASKEGSELFITSREKDAKPLKVTDYHRAGFDGSGYGYGYGGF